MMAEGTGTFDVLGATLDRAAELADEHDRGEHAAPVRGCPECAAVRITPPDKLDGCTCGGIGNTGGHRPGCQWARR